MPFEDIKSLNFSGIHMPNSVFEDLMAVITLFKDVRELNLNDTGINEKNFIFVCDLLYRGLNHLKTLYIQCINY